MSDLTLTFKDTIDVTNDVFYAVELRKFVYHGRKKTADRYLPYLYHGGGWFICVNFNLAIVYLIKDVLFERSGYVSEYLVAGYEIEMTQAKEIKDYFKWILLLCDPSLPAFQFDFMDVDSGGRLSYSRDSANKNGEQDILHYAHDGVVIVKCDGVDGACDIVEAHDAHAMKITML